MLPEENYTEDDVENVRVFIRVRPFINIEENKFNGLIKVNEDTITLSKPDSAKTFKFSKIFDGDCSQVAVYRRIAVPIVEKVFKGYNGTIFAYGQSGSGKTYTMIGNIRKSDLKGIVPNIFSHIFTQISLSNKDVAYAVTVTYLEIYNEEIRDLLSESPNKKLTVHDRPGLGVYVKDLLGFTVDSLEAVNEILVKGNKNRASGSTKLNATSSRSHAIFTVLVETKNQINNKTTFGKLNLVDLAGSERVNKTLATGNRLREAMKINLSLSVLGNVISALIDGKASHVPYRNSKLTRLLQDSLGGNSLTAMVATISPNELDYEESLYTLMYADRVRHIQNHLSINVEKKSVIETFELKIDQLKKELESLLLKEERELKRKRKKSKTSVNNEEFEMVEMEKNILENRISMIQRKILIGGENLLEKAQQQLELLEDSTKELKHLDSSHQMLEEIMHYKGQEKSMVEQQYASLQEEDIELNNKIEEAENLISKAQDVLQKKETEYQNEISSLLHTNKSLAKEMGLANYVVNNYVPNECMGQVKSNLTWIEDIQEWQIKGIAYCGNNLRNKSKNKNGGNSSSKPIFFAYPPKK